MKLEERGRGGSREVHEAFVEGAEISILPPQNFFPLSAASDITLVAGGIGITPLLAMADVLHARGTTFSLVACGRSVAEMPFADRFAQFAFGSAVHARPDSAEGNSSFDAMSDLGAWSEGRELYVCGPQGFMDFVAAQARSLGWPSHAIRSESFGAPATSTVTDPAFTLRLARSERTVPVRIGQQIIDALNEAHVVVDWSCGQGVCGTCVTPVLSGTPEHRDAVLTTEERESGKVICLCVSRTQGDELVIDL